MSGNDVKEPIKRNAVVGEGTRALLPSEQCGRSLGGQLFFFKLIFTTGANNSEVDSTNNALRNANQLQHNSNYNNPPICLSFPIRTSTLLG